MTGVSSAKQRNRSPVEKGLVAKTEIGKGGIFQSAGRSRFIYGDGGGFGERLVCDIE